MTTTEQQQEQTKSKLWRQVESLPDGRSRVQVERGALSHTDQLRLSSVRQRERFAQACELKDPGCYDEILSMLEKEALIERTKYDSRTDDGCRFVFTTLDKFLVQPVDWLWENYIPAGAVTILEGDPGVGKSLVLADLAARVSRGFLAPNRHPAFDEPGHDPEPCPEAVWWFSGHDSVEQTLAPRLLAAGANPSMIRIVEGTEDMKQSRCRPVRFPDDFDPLWKARASAPRLVIIDPLSAFCGGSLHQATANKVIAELAKFAAQTGAAVVVVRPLNRRLGASAAERGSAGPSVTAEARAALLLASHPDDPNKQILAVVKNNLCAKAPSLEIEIVDSAGAPVVAWHGQSPLMADELVRTRMRLSAPRSPFEQKKVEEWLVEKLMDGPKSAKEIDEQAKLDEVPPVLLRRAKISMQIVPTGSNGHTMWRLPDIAFASSERDQPFKVVESASTKEGGQSLQKRTTSNDGAAPMRSD
jgi:hypothetical protein